MESTTLSVENSTNIFRARKSVHFEGFRDVDDMLFAGGDQLLALAFPAFHKTQKDNRSIGFFFDVFGVHGVGHTSEADPDFSFGLFDHIFIKNDDADLLGHGHRHQ